MKTTAATLTAATALLSVAHTVTAAPAPVPNSALQAISTSQINTRDIPSDTTIVLERDAVPEANVDE